VTSTSPSTAIDLQDLQLDDARALLGHNTLSEVLPAPEASATAYLQSVINGLCDLSQKDPLTGLANRRHFRSVLEREIDVVARTGEPALLLMLDIDHFKHVNDTYGHQAGDEVLQTVAKCLVNCVRPMDTVARYGGEEFAVVLPNCQVSFGKTVAERIRQSVEALTITLSSMTQLKITISVGGAFAPEWVRSTSALWIERADIELYRAKAGGRNQVCMDPQETIAVSAEEKSLLFGHLNVADPAWIESISSDAVGSAEHRVN
jgi:two-component system cell cycle response regulator